MTQTRIDQLISQLQLRPHPEGGYFSEQFRSSYSVASPVVGEKRSCVTHIYFLLTHGQLSRWHRVKHDEIWNLYEGDPLRILQLKHGEVEENTIGDIGRGVKNNYFKIIDADHFQAAETTGLYSLLGCTVAPGFDYQDFSYIEDRPTQNQVHALGKDYAKFI